MKHMEINKSQAISLEEYLSKFYIQTGKVLVIILVINQLKAQSLIL